MDPYLKQEKGKSVNRFHSTKYKRIWGGALGWFPWCPGQLFPKSSGAEKAGKTGGS